jgi:DNA helicase-2/ATP-dependent DNA helicase PcrA
VVRRGGAAAAPRGRAAREIALLYRSNAQSRVMESALFNAHIPYKVYGGLRFFERAEVKHALSYLRLIENPNDDTSFLRVVNFPARGIGSRTIEQLQDAAKASGRSLWQSVGAVAGKGGATSPPSSRGSSDARATRGLTLREIIVHMLEASGLVDFYKTDREGKERLENLEELVNAAEAFVTQEASARTRSRCRSTSRAPARLGIYRGEAARPSSTRPAPRSSTSGEIVAPPRLVPDADTGEIMSPLAAFLTHAALEAGDNQAQAGEDAVQMMTIHSAKGLEFDCVFISGLEEACSRTRTRRATSTASRRSGA